MKVEEARKWIGKDSCIHYVCDEHGEGSMGGVVTRVEADASTFDELAVGSEMWLVVDRGMGVVVEAITHIHLTNEPCLK